MAAVTSCENALLCVEFPQVQYIDLSEIVHVVKADVIATSERLDLHVRTLFVCEVSPEWRLKLGFGTKKKCPFPLYRGHPSLEVTDTKIMYIVLRPNFVSPEWSCPLNKAIPWRVSIVFPLSVLPSKSRAPVFA